MILKEYFLSCRLAIIGNIKRWNRVFFPKLLYDDYRSIWVDTSGVRPFNLWISLPPNQLLMEKCITTYYHFC